MLLPATTRWRFSPVNPQLLRPLVPSTALHMALPKLPLTGQSRDQRSTSECQQKTSKEATETKPGQGDSGPQVWFELSSLAAQGQGSTPWGLVSRQACLGVLLGLWKP